jgi:hypothetical protein
MELSEAESRLGVRLPPRHQQAVLDPADPIHEACDFLVPDSPHTLLRWVGVNYFLHGAHQWDRWPPYLVAFAFNGCGDYFAYDLRSDPPRVVYIDPDRTVPEISPPRTSSSTSRSMSGMQSTELGVPAEKASRGKGRVRRPTTHCSGPRARLAPPPSAAEFRSRWRAVQPSSRARL